MSAIPNVTYEVERRFDGLRRRFAASWLAREFALFLAVAAACWIALAAFDYVFELPLEVRRVGLLFLLALLFAWMVYRGSLFCTSINRRSFAAMLESKYADFGQRLRTLLDVCEDRVRGPSEMLSALGHQTLGRWETVAPGDVVPKAQLLLALAAALISVLTTLVLLTAGEWKTALLRGAGCDLSYTSMRAVTGHSQLIEGQPVRVALEMQGRTNRRVSLRYRFAALADEVAKEWMQINLQPARGPSVPPGVPVQSASTHQTHLKNEALFVAELGKATASIEYQFVTSVGSTPIYRIQVEPFIEATACRAVVTSPEYTGLAPREFDGTNISALQNSIVEISIQTKLPLKEARLLAGPKTSQLSPIEVKPMGNAQDSNRWTFELPTNTSLHWRFEGEGANEVPLATVKGRLRVRSDQPPNLSWRGPADEIEVHTLTELPMVVDIFDDYGIVEAGIVFALGDEDEFVLTQWSSAEVDALKPVAADPMAGAQTKVSLSEILPLESFRLTEQDFVAYYAYAVDNCGAAPQRSETDVRYIDVRPLRQKFSEADDTSSGGGIGAGFSTSVGEIIRRQRFLINRTRRLVNSASNLEQMGTIDGLVREQSDLAGLARFLIDRLAALGRDENEALAVAEIAMLQAADSLSVSNVELTLTQQEEAMRALVEAKGSLRNLAVSRLSGGQRQALANLLLQLNQKLRRTPADSDRNIADLLRKLAEDQLRLGDSMTKNSKALASALSAATNVKAESADSGPAKTMGTLAKSDDVEETSGSSRQSTKDSSSSEQILDQRIDNAYDEQLALLNRLQETGDALSERILESELVNSRMTSALAAMGSLADYLRDQSLDIFSESSQTLAAELVELSVLVESISESEAVERLAALSRLMSSLAELEDKSAERSLGGPAEGAANESNEGQLGRQMRARLETLRETLAFPLNDASGTVSSVSAQLGRFLEESQLQDVMQVSELFAEFLAEQAALNSAGSETVAQLAEASIGRSGDFRDAAAQLEAIYRQLVTPQIARLREIEMQASQLEQELLLQSDVGAPGAEVPDQSKSKLRELELSIRSAGLVEIADILRNEKAGEDEGRLSPYERLHRVTGLLRQRIQQLVILDIASDRDMPVPFQYRELVDRYFQAISGAIPEQETEYEQ